MVAKQADEGGNADSWIVVIGLEKNGERLLVLFLWFGGGQRQGGH